MFTSVPILPRDQFEHQQLENMQAFYGRALINAYHQEKSTGGTGLFIDRALLPDCDIFQYEPYDAKSCFVHRMQSLDTLWFDGATDVDFPVSPDFIVPTGSEWFLAYDFTYLRNIHAHMSDFALAPRIRAKYASAWGMIRRRHKKLLDTLETHNFDPRSISDFDWTEAMSRVGTSRGFHG